MLAKTDKSTLLDHTKEVKSMAECLFQPLTHRSVQWAKFFCVDFNNFYRHLRIAALFHDIGKANSEFQNRMETGKNLSVSSVRHEYLSCLFLALPEVKKWLSPLNLDYEVLLSAVICHHLKVSRDKIDYYPHNYEIVYLLSRIDWLVHVSEEFGLEDPPVLKDITISPSTFIKLMKPVRHYIDNLNISLENMGSDRGRLLMAVRSALICADAAGSALRTDQQKVVEQCFQPMPINFIENYVITPSIEKIKTRGTYEKRQVQEIAESLPSRAVLLAPCGNGKTLAAYQWAANQIKKHNKSHLIFLYPTRVTASEGFFNYLQDTSISSLVHALTKHTFEHRGLPSEEDVSFCFKFWGKRIFSATADQFLSFLHNNHKGICRLPIIADSVLVLDEIHSYDKQMFATVLNFLQYFNVPVLGITATLGKLKIEALKKKGVHIEEVVYDDRPRYVFSKEENVYSHIENKLKEGSRILFVCNTVASCQRWAKKLAAKFSEFFKCWHSHFRLDDRLHIENEVISKFSSFAEKKSSIVVCTQVCEMSLDLDCDDLVIELAPIHAIIQRTGRCNRQFRERLSSVLVIDPLDSEGSFNPKPYFDHESYYKESYDFVNYLCGKPVSQGDLELAMEMFNTLDDNAVKNSPFIYHCAYASKDSTSFRVDDHKCKVILNTDLDLYLELAKDNKSVDGLTFDLFYSEGMVFHKDLPKHLSLVPGKNYDIHWGYVN